MSTYTKLGGSYCTWRYLGRFVTLGVYVAIALVLWYTPMPEITSESMEIQSSDLDGKTIIFAATKFFNAPIESSIFNECSEKVRESCAITSRYSRFSDAHAVLFHSRDFDMNKLSTFPFPRRPEIPYVILASENPYYANLENYENYFNWTMTYRKDSDVFAPYGALLKNENFTKVNFTEIWKSKIKETLWLVSNDVLVQNKRKKLVEKLIENGMNIDLYGKVFDREPENCPRFGGAKDCDKKFQSPYKFTIAFENANCKDYVTEKFWRKAERYQMVPIVMSRKIYRDLEIPDDMYIAVDDFESLKDFANFVKKVGENQTEYMKYHKWREGYRIVDANEDPYGFCQLCQRLLDLKNQTIPQKSYSNLKAWHGTSLCDNSFVDRYL